MNNDYYVYTLAYPDGTVFYVGKGRKQRIDHHEYEARKGKQSYKCNVIRQIWASGGQVLKTRVQENMDETAAYQLEIDLIHRYERRHLTNATDGGEGGAGRPIERTGIYRRTTLELPCDLVAKMDASGKSRRQCIEDLLLKYFEKVDE